MPKKLRALKIKNKGGPNFVSVTLDYTHFQQSLEHILKRVRLRSGMKLETLPSIYFVNFYDMRSNRNCLCLYGGQCDSLMSYSVVKKQIYMEIVI